MLFAGSLKGTGNPGSTKGKRTIFRLLGLEVESGSRCIGGDEEEV